MNKNLIIALAGFTMLYFSCSKSNDSENGPKNTNPTPITIQLVSGGGQTDTVGLELANPVVVKVTQSGNGLSNYTVQFQASGCNSDNILTTATGSGGTSSYFWRLAGNVGQQTLKAYVLNSQNQKVDSVTVTSTGLAAGSGWHVAACSLQDGYSLFSIVKLSTGRMFACYSEKRYLRYSDDNGASWNAVTSLGNSHSFLYAFVSPSNEIYVFAENEGPFVSTDGGQTWSSINSQPPSNGSIQSGAATADGKLIVTTSSSVSVSVNNGTTWINTPNTGFVPPNSTGGDTNFVWGGEDQTGALYVIGRESQTVYKSTNNGSTWIPIARAAGETDFGLFIDPNNNWFYKSRSDTNGGIFLSKDNGTTYTQLISSDEAFLDELTVQSDGNYYYENTNFGLYQSSGLTGTTKLIFPVQYPLAGAYAVASNGNVVVWHPSIYQLYYYQK